MDFRGHLRLPDDAGTGIPVQLRLDDIFVVISSGGDELGSWRADDVTIERIYSNQFSIELDGEPMVFIAHDALGFAYEGISAIEALQERLTKRRVFRRSKKKEKAATVEQESTEIQPVETQPVETQPVETRPVETRPVETQPVETQPVETQPAATWDTPVSSPAAPVPADEERSAEPEEAEEPTLTGQPAPIWTPPSAASPSRSTPSTPSTPSDPQPDFEPAIPERIERRFATEDADAGQPEDVRVSYPQPEPPPAPAVETFVPPVEPDEPALEPQEPAQPATVSSVEAPASEAEPAVAEAPEYEIEEVALAASGVSWQSDDESSRDQEEPEAEIEIEDYVLPSAGAVETFAPPTVDADPEAAQPEPAEAEAEPDIGDLPDSDEVAEVPETELPAAAPAAPEPPAESPSDTPDVAAVSNGHRKVDELEGETSKRERRHSLFGRSRDKKVPPHEHRYGDPKTIGGLTRQVCEVCGHVTFSGEDVYQGW